MKQDRDSFFSPVTSFWDFANLDPTIQLPQSQGCLNPERLATVAQLFPIPHMPPISPGALQGAEDSFPCSHSSTVSLPPYSFGSTGRVPNTGEWPPAPRLPYHLADWQDG